MPKGIFVVGTDTEVGKTVVSCGLTLVLREQGMNAVAMKPIASGCREEEGQLVNEDAVALAVASEVADLSLVNPVRLRAPLAPFVAAQMEKQVVDIEKVKAAYRKLSEGGDFTIVEGIGGLFVPIKEDYFVFNLIAELGLPALVVGRAGLGTINHTLMTVELLNSLRVPVCGIILNREGKEPALSEASNKEVIPKLAGVPCFGVLPRVADLRLSEPSFGSLAGVFAENIDVSGLLKSIR